jgi:ribose transport system ATP-binding protein/rhamnose transport system ATP-binding protein
MENLLLSQLSLHRGFRWSAASAGAGAVGIARSLGLPAERLQDPNLLLFSGGMQQKVIIARALSTDPRLLLLDEPTRGVDIETRSTIYRAMRERADQGLAVLWISSDFEELLGVCNRVIVLSDGRAVADLACRELDVEKLMMFAAPKSSSNAVSMLLEQLAERFGGVAFWVYLDGSRVYCFDRVGPAGEAPGLERGTILGLAELGFGAALKTGEDGFALDADGRRRVATVPLTTRRGHYLGHLGMAIPAAAAYPPHAELVRMAHTAMANL